jgi:hypothetical protein
LQKYSTGMAGRATNDALLGKMQDTMDPLTMMLMPLFKNMLGGLGETTPPAGAKPTKGSPKGTPQGAATGPVLTKEQQEAKDLLKKHGG